MKKLLLGLFSLSYLFFVVPQVQAGWVSDAVMKQILQFRANLGASAYNAYPSSYVDTSTVSTGTVSSLPAGCTSTSGLSPTTGLGCNGTTPKITIISPKGGEVYNAGQKISIKWKSNLIVAKTIGIFLQDNDKKSLSTIIDSSLNDGSELITLPKVSGTNFEIFISNDQTGGAYSETFIIKNITTCPASPVLAHCPTGTVGILTYDDNKCVIGQTCNSVGSFCTNGATNPPECTSIPTCPVGCTCSGSDVNCPAITPSITVLSPNGGEIYKAGDTLNVKWSSQSFASSDMVKIELGYTQNDQTYGAGTYFEDLIVDKTANTGSYDWVIPKYYSSGSNSLSFTIKISSGNVSDYSNNKFKIIQEIIGSDINVINPTSGSVYSNGSIVSINWMGKGTDQYVVSLLKKSDPSFLHLSLDASGSMPNLTWKVPSDLLSGSDYFIKVNEGLYRNYTGYSDLFKINSSYVDNTGCLSGEIYSSVNGKICQNYDNLKISVSNPKVGLTYSPGQTISINWTKGNPGLSYITFYKSDSTYSTPARVISNPDNSGSMVYTFPSDMPIGQYKIHAFYEKTINGVTSSVKLFESDGYFNIAYIVDNDGCYGGRYSSTTGQACPLNIVTEEGCSADKIFSSTTGQVCYGMDDNGCKGSKYNSMTGQLCGNYKINEVINKDNNYAKLKIIRTIRRGVTGEDVKTIQKYFGLDADGVYGRGTMAKVKEWQIMNGLYADGVFGSGSRAKWNQ